ncbi:hypothetical protein AMAG_06020 [Allomyces macrogynus ATCC 38327]|uniref:Uncharacterized protein n=1 Tax=Allomyces macrogynus (strain ATCC 38327) TaxID=578462 RepID=A0A0L0SE30_ALLM3|nr:hypothetical protein AMAG_06020 [Allomyces macrogynus ATCC 38327]|eukprot:KNE60645.1 hypothetical protein AMAG_06020 [Allomyces macrogynus ATCC 38327]
MVPPPNRIELKSKVVGVWPTAFRVRGSVLKRVWLPMLIFSLWATFITVINTYVCAFKFPPGIVFITVTSFVISLLLGFRTSSGYDRFNEGRKVWASLTVCVRNLVRVIWIGIDEPKGNDNSSEKIAALKLILAFVISVRNHARGEDGLLDPHGDVKPEYANLLPHYKQSRFETDGALLTMPNHLSMDLLHILTAYTDSHIRAGNIDLPQFSQIIASLNGMADAYTSVERIVSTPIPRAYAVHLQQIVYIYLIMLPLQIYGDFKAWCIMVTALVTFAFVGVEMIGTEIENPFGTDANDLELDEFIAELDAELLDLVSNKRSELIADWDLTEEELAVDVLTQGRFTQTLSRSGTPMGSVHNMGYSKSKYKDASDAVEAGAAGGASGGGVGMAGGEE